MASEEPWDEIMGPPPQRVSFGQQQPRSRSVEVEGSRPADPPTTTGRASSFRQYDLPEDETTNHRWSQYAAEASGRERDTATANAVYMSSKSFAEREAAASISSSSSSHRRDPDAATPDDEMYHNAIKSSSSFDHETIRQEALRIVEIADADSNYDVYKTKSGGYTATAKPKTRAALAGLNLSGGSRASNGNRTWLNDAFYSTSLKNNDKSDLQYAQEDDEDLDDDDDDVIDVKAMERRALASREMDQENMTNTASINNSKKNWSSRYSIDNTLLAMTGGTISKTSVSNMRVHNDPYSSTNARILDQMDRENRYNNMNPSGSFIKGAIFGSAAAFNYRQNHVFGKQNVVLPSSRQPNLQAAFLEKQSAGSDENGTSLPPMNPRSKSWQERMQHKRCQTRVLLIVVTALIISIISFAAVFVNKKHQEAAAQAAAAAEAAAQTVTFYAISDVPILRNDESKMYHSLQAVSEEAKFVVHLGNIQIAAQTRCVEDRYEQVAGFLAKASKKPMFIVPGTEDWIECTNQTDAWKYWTDAFLLFNQRWDQKDAKGKVIERDIQAYHMLNHFENFAFVTQGVLFVGIHEVGGIMTNPDEFKERNAYNYDWITGMVSTHFEEIRAVVIFGNYRPGTQQNMHLFGPLGDFLQKDKYKSLPTLYVHAYSDRNRSINGTSTLYEPFLNVPNIQAVSSNKGTSLPPLRINVGYGSNPFTLG